MSVPLTDGIVQWLTLLYETLTGWLLAVPIHLL